MPRSLILYIAASSVYAALVFFAVHATYGFELGRAGVSLPSLEAVLTSIDTVSLAIWIGLSLIGATVLYSLARALESARGEGYQRQGEIASIFALGQALSGSLELDTIAERFLTAALTSLGPTVTGALYVQEEDGYRLASERGPNTGKHWPLRYTTTTLPAPLRTRVVDHQSTLVLADAVASPAWQTLAPALRDTSRIRSFAAMPIVSHDRLVGIALFASDRVDTLKPDALQIVALGAQFLASALRTSLSFRETEARGTREALVNRIAQRARAAQEPDAVLRATVDELARALGVRRVGIAVGSKPDELRIAHSWTRDSGTPPATLAASRQAAATGRTTQLTDETASRLATPIVIAGELAGVLAISDDVSREWSINDVRLVEAVAREIRGAMEAARLLQSRQRENERLLALQRASAVVVARTTTRDVIDEVLRTASSLLGEAAASLYLLDEATGELQLAQNADPHGRAVSERLLSERGSSVEVLLKLEPVVVNDYQSWEGASNTGRETGIQAVLAVPLVRAGSLLGAVVLRSYDAGTRFTVEDARLLALFGDQAVAALTHAEAFERQRAAVEQLERVNRAKSEFVSIVSHEFRTPLTGIQGFSELMKDELLTPAEMKEYAGDIFKDAQRLNRLITEMLDLDRMEAGRMSLHIEPTDLNAIVSEAADRVRPNAPGHPITLSLDERLPEIPADRDRLTQVAANLLSNAVKYSPTGGEILLTTARDGPHVHLTVRDHGMGIPADKLDSIWERFGRVESDKTRGIQGTGLGLPIVKQIVAMHGGSVWAESEIGRGTVFHVLLPLAAPSEAVEA
jgi:signal transduction histidine kinase